MNQPPDIRISDLPYIKELREWTPRFGVNDLNLGITPDPEMFERVMQDFTKVINESGMQIQLMLKY